MGWKLYPVTYGHNGMLHTVTAQVRGEWCLHRIPHPDPTGGWQVTHMITGINITKLADDLTERDARRIVKALVRDVPTIGVYHVLSITELRKLDPEIGRIIEAVVAESLADHE
jgi:hypothetical protein